MLSKPILAPHVVRALVGTAWTLLRLPLLTLMVILEPVIRFVLGALSLLLLLMALFLKLVAPHTSPFWGMLGLALACAGVLALYQWLIRVL